MNIERLKDIQREVDNAIVLQAHGSFVAHKSPDEAAANMRSVGAVPRIHHCVIGDFAITDLRELRAEISNDFYSKQP